MGEQSYEEDRFVWLNGDIINVNEAKINVLSPTSQFGLNVFEGIRCYWNEEGEQLFAFRLDDHYRRLNDSLKLMRIENKYSIKEMKQALIDIVRANDYREDIAIRQTVFVEGFGSWYAKKPVGMFVAPIPKRRAILEKNTEGLRCCVSTWRRIDDNSISPRIKCGANYINSRMAQLEAIENGYDSAIFLNVQGKVCEGPGSCFFLIRDGVLISPPITDSVLESITRDTILKLAKAFDIETEIRHVDRTELYICHEAFLCGSSMEIAPIHSIDGIEIKSEKPNAITIKLQNIYLDVVSGKCTKWHQWLTKV